MITAQALAELRLTLRRGESLLLTLVIPVLLLVVLTRVPVVSVSGPRADFYVPGILALAVVSTAFTGQAIATGYERHYGVLKRLGTTALPRAGLLTAKTVAVVVVELLQLAVLAAVGLALGWSPHGNLPAAVALVVLGTAAASGLGLLLAGTLRAETTLAAANLLWFLFLLTGGVVFPLSAFSPTLRAAVRLLPLTALADGLRAVLTGGVAVPGQELLVLAAWAVASLAAASVTFRWD